jgi:hypothetical protein
MAARRRKGRRAKALAVGLLPAAATAVALTTGTGTAGANTTTTSHTFQDSGGGSHTCTISLTRTHPFGGDDQVGEGGTAVSGSDPACTDAIAHISATWTDPDGIPDEGNENSDGASTLRRYAPIFDDFTTIHRVDFSGPDCDTNCEFNATRTK